MLLWGEVKVNHKTVVELLLSLHVLLESLSHRLLRNWRVKVVGGFGAGPFDRSGLGDG